MLEKTSQPLLLALESKTVFYLRKDFYQQNTKKRANILSEHSIQHWQNWLIQTALKHPDCPNIIDSFSAQWLWLDSVPSSGNTYDDDALDLALWRHYDQSQHHLLPLSLFSADPDPLMNRLATIGTVFQKQLHQHHLASDIELLKMVQNTTIHPPKMIDFHSSTPLQRSFFTQQYSPQYEPLKSPNQILHYPDEISALLDLSSRLEKWSKADKTVAIITPHVDALVGSLQSLPETAKWLEQLDISTAMPLSDHPAIAVPLSMLTFDWPWIQTVDIHRLMNHPVFTNAATEQDRKVLLKIQEPFVRIDRIPTTWKNIPLIQTLENIHKLRTEHHHPYQWISKIIEVFSPLSWPQHTNTNPQVQRVLSKWFTHLESLITLPLKNSLDFDTFIHRLKLITKSLYHQPTHRIKNCVVLRPEEAYGLTFDECFFYDLHPQSWPTQPQLRSLFPLSIRQRIFPSLFEQHQQATQYLTTLCRSIPTVSIALIEKDDHYPTAYLLGPQQEPVVIEHTLETKKAQRSHLQCAPFVKHTSPPRVSTYTLKHQAECPFKAFALHRLDAAAPQEATLGLNPMEKGELLHQILESLLNEQSTVQHITEHHISKCINRCLDEWQHFKPTSLSEPFRTVEHHRLLGLLKEWLKHEQSLPYTNTRHLEQSCEYSTPYCTIRMRIDRIDTHNNHKWVLDYKTGNPSSRHWFTERLMEPQLPLYALSIPDTESVAFYQINHKTVTLKGVCEKGGTLSGMGIRLPEETRNRSWDQQIEKWKIQINDLAKEFYQGVYSVTPQPEACQTCHLSSLCRIHDKEHADEAN